MPDKTLMDRIIQTGHEYLNPTYLDVKAWDMPKDWEVPSSTLSKDLLRKFIGGVALAAVLEGGRRAAGHTPSDRDKKTNEAVRDYISTKYISIPSESEPDVDRELRKKANEDVLWGAGQAGKGLLSIGKSIAGHKTPTWYLPASIAALMAGLIGGQRFIGGRLDEKEKQRISEKTKDINKDIGKLVQDEYQRTRGEKEAMFEAGSTALNTLMLIGFLTGTGAGYLKGRSDNPSLIMHKKLADAIAQNQSVYDAPKILVPNSLRGEGLKSKENQPSQEQVRLEEMYV